MTKREWVRFGSAAYLPTLVSMMGAGAIIPLIPLLARHLGAGVPEAAFVAGLLGFGLIAGALPAGIWTEKIGERKSLVLACIGDAIGIFTMIMAPNLYVLGLATFWSGLQQATIGLARQSYLTEAFPSHKRARALSTLGGVYRIGSFVGPLIGATLIHDSPILTPAFVFAICMSLLAALIAAGLPELPANTTAEELEDVNLSIPHIMRTHAFTYLTQGLGAAALNLIRSARDTLLPLWCQSQGLHASTTSLMFAVCYGIDMLLFYFGGKLMDKHGRRFVAIPACLVMGLCFAIMPFTHHVATISIVAVMLGLGNGISSGVVMTLGSDAAPRVGRAKFLSGWRFTASMGAGFGPLVITAVSASAGLSFASFTIAGIGVIAAAWLRKWVPKQLPHH